MRSAAMRYRSAVGTHVDFSGIHGIGGFNHDTAADITHIVRRKRITG